MHKFIGGMNLMLKTEKFFLSLILIFVIDLSILFDFTMYGVVDDQNIQQIVNHINSLSDTALSNDSFIINSFKDDKIQDWQEFLNYTLNLVDKSDKELADKSIDQKYVQELIDITEYFKNLVVDLHSKYANFLNFDKDTKSLSIKNKIFLNSHRLKDVANIIDQVNSKSFILAYIVKNMIQRINSKSKSLYKDLDLIGLNLTKYKSNNKISKDILKLLENLLNNVKYYAKLYNSRSASDNVKLFKIMVSQYKDINIFTQELIQLKKLLIERKKNKELISIIDNLFDEIIVAYPYIAPIISEEDIKVIYDSGDKLSVIILLEAVNLKNAFGRFSYELNLLYNSN